MQFISHVVYLQRVATCSHNCSGTHAEILFLFVVENLFFTRPRVCFAFGTVGEKNTDIIYGRLSFALIFLLNYSSKEHWLTKWWGGSATVTYSRPVGQDARTVSSSLDRSSKNEFTCSRICNALLLTFCERIIRTIVILIFQSDLFK